MVQNHLCAVDRKRRNDHASAASDRALDHIGELLGGILVVVGPVSVGRFDHQPIDVANRRRRNQQWVIRTPEIATEPDRCVRRCQPSQHRCRSKNVTGWLKSNAGPLGDLEINVERVRHAELKRRKCVLFGIQRKCRVMTRIARTVGVLGFLLEQAGAVWQHNSHQPGCVLRDVDRASIPVSDKSRQIPAMVEVSVAQHDRVESSETDRRVFPVALAQFPPTLEQAAIEEHRVAAVLQQELAPGDRTNCSEHRERRAGTFPNVTGHTPIVDPDPDIDQGLTVGPLDPF